MTYNVNISETAWARYVQVRGAYGQLLERDEVALYAQCLEFQVLKAPASAIFPPLNQMIVNGGAGRYSVTGYVDSQNSYGAMIRSNYTFMVERDAYGRWVCPNRMVSMESQIAGAVIGSYILYLALGIISTLIFYFIIMNSMNF